LRKVIYTVITGGYDKLKEPMIVNNNWDYVCFTDNTAFKSKVWKIKRFNANLNKKKLSRLPKIKWFDFLDHDLSIYLDGSYQIKYNLNALINEVYEEGKHNAFKHWIRACSYREGWAVKVSNYDTAETVDKYMEFLKSQGFPKKAGLMANGFMIRDKSLPKEPYIKWFEDVVKYSHRDQLSFMYHAQDLPLNFINPKLRHKFLKGGAGHVRFS
jgi:hypothetical protein